MRKQTQRVIALMLLVVATPLVLAVPADAGLGTRTKDGTLQAEANVQWAKGGSGSDGCDYVPASSTAAEQPVGDIGLFDGIVHLLFSRFCDGEFVGTVWLSTASTDDLLLQASAEVERRLPSPTPVMVWPDPDYDWAYAQVPIDFRAQQADWQPIEATATVSHAFASASVTIRAVPTDLTFGSGDHNGTPSATCSGDAPLAGYNPHVPGDCVYTYRNASSTARHGNAFAASMTIDWAISYWSTTHPGFAGTLPDLTTRTDFPIEVAEVKILGVAHP